jgi:hypothetical protein
VSGHTLSLQYKEIVCWGFSPCIGFSQGTCGVNLHAGKTTWILLFSLDYAL